MENITEYDDNISEFAQCTFNLIDRVVNFSWLLYEFNKVSVQREKYCVGYTRTTYEVYTFKNKNEKNY